LYAQLDVGGVATSGQFVADAGHSAYWGGLKVSDTDGQPVETYSLTADSGTDWRKSLIPSPVPEPSAAILSILGLAILDIARRRAKR